MNDVKNIDARSRVIEVAARKAGVSYHELNIKVRVAMSQLGALSYYEFEKLVHALTAKPKTEQTYIRL